MSDSTHRPDGVVHAGVVNGLVVVTLSPDHASPQSLALSPGMAWRLGERLKQLADEAGQWWAPDEQVGVTEETDP